MSVYVVVRTLDKYSEVWLQRQLTSHNFFSKVFVAGDIKGWTGNPPAVKLPTFNGLLDKLSRKLRGKAGNLNAQRCSWLATQLRPGDTLVFHFISFALHFKPLIETGRYNVFVYCHGYDVTWDKFDYEKQAPYYKSSYVPEVVELSRNVKFICNSISTKNKMLSIGIDPKRLALNYFGIDLPVTHKTNPEVFTILYLGRLVDFKGPDLVIDAYEIACRRGMKAKLIVAGDGYLRPCVELKRKRSDFKESIEILGAVNADKAKELFLISSIFTAHNCKGELTNQEEAFGVSIIEAMSYGLPVVTGRNGGLVDSVVDGETGILFEPFDVQAQAEAFYRLYNDRQFHKQLSETSVARVKEHFSVDQEHANLLKIFANE